MRLDSLNQNMFILVLLNIVFIVLALYVVKLKKLQFKYNIKCVSIALVFIVNLLFRKFQHIPIITCIFPLVALFMLIVLLAPVISNRKLQNTLYVLLDDLFCILTLILCDISIVRIMSILNFIRDSRIDLIVILYVPKIVIISILSIILMRIVLTIMSVTQTKAINSRA